MASKGGFHPIQKSGSGYHVIAKSTGKPLSTHPLSHEMAERQLAAVEFHKHGGHDTQGTAHHRAVQRHIDGMNGQR